MRILLQIISFLGLALTVVPAILVFLGQLPFETNQTLMFIGMVLWFGATPFWIGKDDNKKAPSNS
jgi:hypothetical protein